jgi:hypothetical protein
MKTASHQRTIIASEETRNQKPEEDGRVVRDFTARPEGRRDLDSELSALELANRTKDAWLIAQSRKLREPMSSMASMLGLMELSHKLAIVRPLHQSPSEFDEAGFKLLRRNFQSLLGFFNELSEVTGETPLRIERDERPGAFSE